MKKLILIFVLCSLISAFGADWSEFYINGGDSPYLWIVAPAEMLETPIPEGLPWSTVTVSIDEQGEPVTRQKTLKEYTFPHMRHDLGDGTVLFLVRAMAAPTMRPDKFTDADADMWMTYFTAYGYTNFLTKAEADALMPEVEE